MARFEQAAKTGFTGVEFWFPYEYSAQEIKQQLDAHNLQQVLFNLPAGDWNAGERGIACHPNRQDEFKAGVARAISYAKILHCTQCNVLAGIKPKDISDDEAKATLINNLRYAADKFSNANLTLLVEAINTFDVPGFFVNTTQDALDFIAEANRDNLYYQYDIYHMHRMEGDVINTIQQNLAQIMHIQFADHPGRHEPGTGEINLDEIFNAIDAMAFQGWVSAEYLPASTTYKSIQWFNHKL